MSIRKIEEVLLKAQRRSQITQLQMEIEYQTLRGVLVEKHGKDAVSKVERSVIRKREAEYAKHRG